MSPDKQDNRRAAIAILVAVLVLLVGGAAWIMKLGSSPSNRGEMIATVDGTPIYLRDAISRVEGLSTAHSGGARSLGSEWEDRVLESLVDDVLIRQEAGRLGIEVTDQEMADSLLNLQGMFASLEEYETWLASQGIDQDELERRIRLQRLATDVYVAVTADVTVSAAEARDYFESHRDEFLREDGSPASFAEVRDKVQQQAERQAKDAVYADWLDERRAAVEVVVVDEGWWRSVQDEQQG